MSGASAAPPGDVAILDAELAERNVEPGDVIRALLLMAEMRGSDGLPRDCLMGCESLRMQLHTARPINFATVMCVIRGLGVQLRAEPMTAAQARRHTTGV